jgi:hypothetical protein
MSWISRSALVVTGWLCGASLVCAQPTYKLDVKPEFRPRARVSIDSGQVRRTPVANDPGFRLQFHVQKEGKSVAALNARPHLTAELPMLEPGLYTVALEVFYPGYRGGTAQKGEFRIISNLLTFRVDPGTPPKLTPVAVPPPTAIPLTAGPAALLIW